MKKIFVNNKVVEIEDIIRCPRCGLDSSLSPLQEYECPEGHCYQIKDVINAKNHQNNK